MFRMTSWTALAKMYGAFRNYTMLIYGAPDGSAAKSVPMAMGVFRLSGVYNNQPLYKKDEGEMYLYFLDDAWMVGPAIGVEHTWLRRKMKAGTKMHLWSILPDLLSGWEFQAMSDKRHFEADWKGDVTLTCQPLQEVEKIMEPLYKASYRKFEHHEALEAATGVVRKSLKGGADNQIIDTVLENFHDNRPPAPVVEAVKEVKARTKSMRVSTRRVFDGDQIISTPIENVHHNTTFDSSSGMRKVRGSTSNLRAEVEVTETRTLTVHSSASSLDSSDEDSAFKRKYKFSI